MVSILIVFNPTFLSHPSKVQFILYNLLNMLHFLSFHSYLSHLMLLFHLAFFNLILYSFHSTLFCFVSAHLNSPTALFNSIPFNFIICTSHSLHCAVLFRLHPIILPSPVLSYIAAILVIDITAFYFIYCLLDELVYLFVSGRFHQLPVVLNYGGPCLPSRIDL